MSLSLDGEPLTTLLVAALGEAPPPAGNAESAREQLFRALLDHPVCIAELGPGAPPGAVVRLGQEQMPVRLFEAQRLGAPVVPLFTSASALLAVAAERQLWPDGVERAAVLDKGAAFPLLRGHPGALLIGGPQRQLALDAGDVAALAERSTPSDYVEGIRKLVASGRPREAARRLAARPVYTLGHPQGGMLTFTRDLPVFLSLAGAESFAIQLSQKTGQRPQTGMVSAAELFKNAVRGRLFVLIDPGPRVIRLRPDDLR